MWKIRKITTRLAEGNDLALNDGRDKQKKEEQNQLDKTKDPYTDPTHDSSSDGLRRREDKEWKNQTAGYGYKKALW